jgi:hypothetical protein
MFWRAGILALTTLIVSESLWVGAYWVPSLVSYRAYTVAAVFQVAFGIAVLASVVDACHHYLKLPARQLALIAAVLFVALYLFPSPIAQPPAGQLESESATASWYDYLEKRIQATDPRRPVIFVAASGGGSRAALFTALVLEALAKEPFLDSEGKELRTGPDGKPRPASLTWADQIVLISGVSGGSLATAYYANRVTRPPEPETADLHNSFAAELRWRFFDEFSDNTFPSIPAIYRESWKQRAPAEDLQSIFGPEAVKTDPRYQWVLQSPFMDAMCTDFMAPLVRGILTPGIERGTALSRLWEPQFGWTRCDNVGGYDGAFGPERPLILLNACSARAGTRFMVGFPPLPRGIGVHGPKENEGDPSQTLATAKLFHAQTLADFWPHYQVSLAEGVRMSANFPWGLHTARLRKQVYTLSEDALRTLPQDKQRWEQVKRLILGDEATRPVKRKELLELLPQDYRPWAQTLERGDDAKSEVDALRQLVPWLHELQFDIYVRPALRERARCLLGALLAVDKLLEKREEVMDLLDGGVNDNTGIPALWEVVQHLHDLALRPDPDSLADPSIRLAAKWIWSELVKRGVLLVEIDSGAKPSLEEVAEVLTPTQALNNAAYANAFSARRWYLRQLNTLLIPPVLEEPDPFAALVVPGGEEPPHYHVLADSPMYVKTFECNHSQRSDVMTAWSLGPKEKAHVLATFYCEYRQWTKLPQGTFHTWLAACELFKGTRKRPPAGVTFDHYNAALKEERQGNILLKGGFRLRTQ